MSSEKILYEDKVGVLIPGPPINQVQAVDLNEIKTVVNAHADEIDALGVAPTLQEVTDEGNTTTNNIVVTNINGIIVNNTQGSAQINGGSIVLSDINASSVEITSSNVSSGFEAQFPDKLGVQTIAMLSDVGGDQNLQDVTDEGNVTYNPLRVQVGTKYSEIKEDGLYIHDALTAATAHLDASLISADITLQVPNQAGVKIIATNEDLATKQNTITGGASSIVDVDMIISRAMVSNASGKAAVSTTTATEIGFVGGVTSAIQTQLNTKAPLASPTFTGNPTAPTPTANDNDTSIATTAFVTGAVTTLGNTKLTSVGQGTNISIDYTNPLIPVISGIAGTTAGVISRVYFTADTVALSQTYRLTNSAGKGTVASFLNACPSSNGVTTWSTNRYCSALLTSAVNVPKGGVTSFLDVSWDSAGTRQLFMEIYFADSNGVVYTNPDVTAPVGSLGVRVMYQLSSGIYNALSSSIMQIGLTVDVNTAFTIPANNRAVYVVGALKTGGGGGSIATYYSGTSYNSFIDVPVNITTTTVINVSAVAGATATDALNGLNTSKEPIGQQSSLFWTGAQVVNWNNIVVKATLTGNTTLTDTNLPISPNTRIIERWIKGNFALTLPVGWTAQKGNDNYNGTVMNRLVIECTNLSGAEYIVYTLKNMTT